MSEPVLEVDELTIRYRTADGPLTAVSNASFTIDEAEYFGLVGESGCGKSTIAKSVIGALDPNGEVASGSINYKGRDLTQMTEDELNKEIRWEEISWIPQSSMNSLDPLQRVSDQAIEIGKTHTDLGEAEILQRFREMFNIVGLQESRIADYPHQFSGGMQQRAIIALALFLEPSLLIADEPTTALDVIMQDQILKYMDDIREETDTSMIMITHDISLIFETCEKMAIMHAGQVCEYGSTSELFDEPHHPYSILLQEAFPDYRYPDRTLEIIEGHPPQNMGDVDYCTFVDRCPWAVEECHNGEPPLEPIEGSGGVEHEAACVRKNEVLDMYREEQEKATDVADAGGDD
jgi:oligopeptide/dipeptide ABC transporter ATP-binding protein